MKNVKILFAMCAVLVTMVAGCGGGSSSGSANVNGVFSDAPVQGLSYECGNPVAVTGPGGTFACPPGSVATFSVGGIVICTQTVQALITPLSCVQSVDPTANTSTPAVVSVVQFLLSISTTPASSGGLTIAPEALTAAAGLTLDFSTATQGDLTAAVAAISPGATLVDAATAEAELTTTILTTFAGNYGGTWTETSDSANHGTWQIVVASDGSVTGTVTDSQNQTAAVAGNLVSGTTYSGTAGSAEWIGTLDTSQTPAVFSGTWSDESSDGTFTGTGT